MKIFTPRALKAHRPRLVQCFTSRKSHPESPKRSTRHSCAAASPKRVSDLRLIALSLAGWVMENLSFDGKVGGSRVAEL